MQGIKNFFSREAGSRSSVRSRTSRADALVRCQTSRCASIRKPNRRRCRRPRGCFGGSPRNGGAKGCAASPAISVLRLAFGGRATATLMFAEFALLSGPLLLLLGRHHAPNLPSYVLADHFQLLLLRFRAQRRILLHRRDLLLAVLADRLDLRFLLVRQLQRRIIFGRVRAHRPCAARVLPRTRGRSTTRSRAGGTTRRSPTRLLCHHCAPISQAQRHAANHRQNRNLYIHGIPFRPFRPNLLTFNDL